MAAESLDQAKTRIAEAVDRLADDLEKISLQIHGNPELCFKEEKAAAAPPKVDYDDGPLGRTQVLVVADNLIQSALQPSPLIPAEPSVGSLRRDAYILSLLYEMANTLGSVFDLQTIFDKATDILLRITPADRVLALLTDPSHPAAPGEDAPLRVVAMKTRDPKLEERAARTAIGRTITPRRSRASFNAAASSPVPNNPAMPTPRTSASVASTRSEGEDSPRSI